jgi:hypothetical protein
MEEKQQQQHRRSLMCGVLIAPWTVPLGLPILIFGDLVTSSFDDAVFISVLFMSGFILIGIPFTYLVTLGLVLPMALLLRRNNALSSTRLCVWYSILGPVTFFAYQSIFFEHPLLFFNFFLDFNSILTYSGLGLTSGVAFCAVSGVRVLAHKEATS